MKIPSTIMTVLSGEEYVLLTFVIPPSIILIVSRPAWYCLSNFSEYSMVLFLTETESTVSFIGNSRMALLYSFFNLRSSSFSNLSR